MPVGVRERQWRETTAQQALHTLGTGVARGGLEVFPSSTPGEASGPVVVSLWLLRKLLLEPAVFPSAEEGRILEGQGVTIKIAMEKF